MDVFKTITAILTVPRFCAATRNIVIIFNPPMRSLRDVFRNVLSTTAEYCNNKMHLCYAQVRINIERKITLCTQFHCK